VEGRKGRTPKWPLERHSSRELVLWKQEWKRPQAVEWERNGQFYEVAMYVRAAVFVEQGIDVKAADRTVVIRMMDALGLTIPGMRANRWVIAATEDAAGQPVRTQASSRERLKVVSGGRA
jgi:hypothetical protein